MSLVVCSVTGLESDRAAAAIEVTMARCPRATRGMLICGEPPKGFYHGVEVVMPDDVKGLTYTGYSEFVLKRLCDFVEEDHALVVQPDGFALNPEKWDDAFLEWDFIGAPWPEDIIVFGVPLTNRVGNGGFCIRSKGWLEAGRDAPPYDGENDDVYCCQKYREHYTETHGLKVAPLLLACHFSVELPIKECPNRTHHMTYGFHGYFHGRGGLLLPVRKGRE